MQLHLISFNVPFPANYGGVIDIFYKIKALHQLGIQIRLHCFEYGRREAEVLEQYCTKVYYYKRQTGVLAQFSPLPYIVNSRKSTELLQNLLTDTAPILFEGLHCCYYLHHPTLAKRQKLVRMHNIEWEYYQHLANLEANPIKKIFFNIESWRLKQFQHRLQFADDIIAISKQDQSKLEKEYTNISYVPAFHNCETMDIKTGKGNYALFHGDLSVKDNEESALYLIQNVFKDITIPFVIAGLHPTSRLTKAVKPFPHIQLKANLPYEDLQHLIQEAQVNILVSFQSAGMKLKLLNALFNGRFCIVNHYMKTNTALDEMSFIIHRPKAMQEQLQQLMSVEFTDLDKTKRSEIFKNQFSNLKNAKQIAELLEQHRPLT
jgi:hypothetical protein